MRKFRVKIWEVGKSTPIVTEYSGDVTQKEVEDFFGCNQPDVAKYEIKQLR